MLMLLLTGSLLASSSNVIDPFEVTSQLIMPPGSQRAWLPRRYARTAAGR